MSSYLVLKNHMNKTQGMNEEMMNTTIFCHQDKRSLLIFSCTVFGKHGQIRGTDIVEAKLLIV